MPEVTWEPVENLPPQLVEEFNNQMSIAGGSLNGHAREGSRNSDGMDPNNFEGWEEQQPQPDDDVVVTGQ